LEVPHVDLEAVEFRPVHLTGLDEDVEVLAVGSA
jgi:hypothetical protein